MYIIGKAHLDAQNRATITGLFGTKKVKYVVLAILVDCGIIEIIPVDYEADFGSRLSVDSKNRIRLPQWVLDQLSQPDQLYLAYNDGKYYMIEQI